MTISRCHYVESLFTWTYITSTLDEYFEILSTTSKYYTSLIIGTYPSSRLPEART